MERQSKRTVNNLDQHSMPLIISSPSPLSTASSLSSLHHPFGRLNCFSRLTSKASVYPRCLTMPGLLDDVPSVENLHWQLYSDTF